MKGKLKYLLTGLIVAVAVIVVLFKYWDYVVNPWTRNGQVRAQVVQITPRVSAPTPPASRPLPLLDRSLARRHDDDTLPRRIEGFRVDRATTRLEARRVFRFESEGVKGERKFPVRVHLRPLDDTNDNDLILVAAVEVDREIPVESVKGVVGQHGGGKELAGVGIGWPIFDRWSTQ